MGGSTTKQSITRLFATTVHRIVFVVVVVVAAVVAVVLIAAAAAVVVFAFVTEAMCRLTQLSFITRWYDFLFSTHCQQRNKRFVHTFTRTGKLR